MRDFLLEVLFDALLAADLTPNDLHAYAKANGIAGVDNARLSDWGKGRREPSDMDRFVIAVAGVTGKRPIALWRRALTEWGHDPGGLTLQVRQSNRRASQDAQARRNRGRRKRS